MSKESDKIKMLETVDSGQFKQYITDRLRLVEELKDKCLFLANTYGENIKVEIDVNPKVQSVKLSVKEYF
jgi:hypothetical protein